MCVGDGFKRVGLLGHIGGHPCSGPEPYGRAPSRVNQSVGGSHFRECVHIGPHTGPREAKS
jgi:hypothetical protein